VAFLNGLSPPILNLADATNNCTAIEGTQLFSCPQVEYVMIPSLDVSSGLWRYQKKPRQNHLTKFATIEQISMSVN
jgi:hypothetical protein